MSEIRDEQKSYKAIKTACLYYLARREHSLQELVQKVSIKGFAKSAIMPILEELTEQGLQSNARFAESYARSRVHKGFGPLHIQAELQQRGAGDCYFEMAVEDIADSWHNLLEQVYCKKYGTEDCPDSKEKFRRSQFLRQRGFPAGMIQHLFKNLPL